MLPLACLLELDSCGVQVSDLDQLDTHWRNYRIFPMACNIQLVFYRPAKGAKGDILVKALLNERETSLPVKTNRYPYYRWADLRQYYLDKLAGYDAQEAAMPQKPEVAERYAKYYTNLPVDITGRTTVPELREALELSAAGIPAGDLVKFTLEGTYTQETHKDLRFLTEQMADRFWFVKIKDESRLALDRESYENDVSLKGEFLRLVMASDLEDADRDAVIRAGLQALSGEAID